MKHNLIKNAVLALVVATSFTACKKEKAALAPIESYKIVGRIDAARTTIPTATLTDATFTISYNNANSFGDAQSVISGSAKLGAYVTGVSGGDSCAFFSTQSNGPVINFINIGSSSTNVNSPNNNNYYNYFNGPNMVFNITSFPFTNDITTPLKEGKGYLRIGKNPKYVYVVLDNVTKL